MTNPDVSLIEQAVFETLRQALTHLKEAPDVTATSRLSGLGLDSLKLVEIVYELETRFNVSTDEDMLAELVTVADLVRVFEYASIRQA